MTTAASCETCGGILLASVFATVVDQVAGDHRRSTGHEVTVGPFADDALRSAFEGVVRQRGPAA